jgi:hydrogenase-1 operon protein HyaF
VSQQRIDLCYSNLATGMARAVVAEIADRLQALAASGSESVIDLRSLPLTEADIAELEEWLGEGEVNARIDVIGETEVRETGYAGVWWIRHLGAGQQVAAEEIAITPVPEILRSQAEDVALAASQIRKQLEADESAGEEREAIHG